jgi:hypothetical protein
VLVLHFAGFELPLWICAALSFFPRFSLHFAGVKMRSLGYLSRLLLHFDGIEQLELNLYCISLALSWLVMPQPTCAT